MYYLSKYCDLFRLWKQNCLNSVNVGAFIVKFMSTEDVLGNSDCLQGAIYVKVLSIVEPKAICTLCVYIYIGENKSVGSSLH